MSKVFCFGDVHFSSINAWNYQAGENFINWFNAKDFGNKDDVEMIFVGDIAERDVNPGNVVDQMWRLFSTASKKAKSVHVVCGNHDKKLYHDIEQHSLKFLTNLPNVFVYEKETEIVTENGYNILILPWQATSAQGIALSDYYNQLSEKYKDKTFDIITGHWNIKEISGPLWAQNGVDISNYHAKCYAIGHIHLRIRDEYVGSIFPNNIEEQNDSFPRGYKVYENGVETFEPLPRFLKYVTLKFGEEKPLEESNCSYAYIITECNTEAEAREKYPDTSIKGIERVSTRVSNSTQVSANSELGAIQDISNKYIENLPEAFSEFIRENGISMSRTTGVLVKKVLSS